MTMTAPDDSPDTVREPAAGCPSNESRALVVRTPDKADASELPVLIMNDSPAPTSLEAKRPKPLPLPVTELVKTAKTIVPWSYAAALAAHAAGFAPLVWAGIIIGSAWMVLVVAATFRGLYERVTRGP